MITIQDWVAVIPEEDRHLAYVGEHQSVMRQFLLTGEGWEKYLDWGFHLDMAFDLSTVTVRDTRQMESTKVESSETVSDTLVKTSADTKKEKYTVSDVTVDCHSPTDVAYLDKVLTENGILLTWQVLRQHTQLPGRLWANVRALGNDGEVKKSAVMVFDVGASVAAEAAADLPQSEMEAMEQHMDEMLDAVLKNTRMVEERTAAAREQAELAQDYAQRVEYILLEAQNISFDVANQVEGIREQVQQVANENATQGAAVSQLVTEMDDLCTAYTGSRYESPGLAVRSQAGAAMMEIGLLDARVTALEGQGVTADEALDVTSTNPVQNKAVAEGVNAVNVRVTQVQNKVTTLENKMNTLWTLVQDHLKGQS